MLKIFGLSVSEVLGAAIKHMVAFWQFNKVKSFLLRSALAGGKHTLSGSACLSVKTPFRAAEDQTTIIIIMKITVFWLHFSKQKRLRGQYLQTGRRQWGNITMTFFLSPKNTGRMLFLASKTKLSDRNKPLTWRLCNFVSALNKNDE